MISWDNTAERQFAWPQGTAARGAPAGLVLVDQWESTHQQVCQKNYRVVVTREMDEYTEQHKTESNGNTRERLMYSKGMINAAATAAAVSYIFRSQYNI